MASTGIPYATKANNPVHGCTKIGQGCVHCWAERVATTRLKGRAGYPEDKPFRVVLDESKLLEPLRWRDPQRVMTCSMGDLFQSQVPDSYLDRIFAVRALTSRHTHMLFTKRVDRALEYTTDPETPRRIGQYMNLGTVLTVPGRYDADGGQMAVWHQLGVPWPLPNVWIIASASTQAEVDRIVPVLLQIPAAKHGLSLEPLVGEVDLSKWLPIEYSDLGGCWIGAWPGPQAYERTLDWVVVGCESGPDRRPMRHEWAEQLLDQCVAAEVPFYYKQASTEPDGSGRVVVHPSINGRQWMEIPGV